MSCFRYAFFGGRSASSSSSSRRRRRRGGEGGRRRRKTRATTIHYSRATWLPSVRPSVRPSVSCVFSFSLKPVLSFSFFFLLRGGCETHTKKQDNPPTSSTARHYCLTIYSHEAINQSISSIHSFYTHTHTHSLSQLKPLIIMFASATTTTMRGASTSSSSSSSRIRRSHRHRQNTRRTSSSSSRVVIHSALYTGTPADFKEKGDQISFDSWDPLGLLSASSHSAFDERAQDSLFGFGGMMRTKSNKKSSSKNNKNSKKTENTSSNKRTTSSRQSTKTSAFGTSSGGDDDGNFGDFFSGDLPQKVATILALLVVSRIGAYIPISGVDRTAFAESLSNTGGVMSYVDTLTGGSISKLGIFSLGIVPFINSSIIFQLLSSVFPELQKLQKEEGESGRRQFMQYQRYVLLLEYSFARILFDLR